MNDKSTPAIDSELLRTTIGYDNLAEELESISKACPKGYPPTNISRISRSIQTASETFETTSEYEITMAVAGFTMDDIEITQTNNILNISGFTTILANDGIEREFLHKGIAERNFGRQYRLESHCEVTSATLKDGILTILISKIKDEEETKVIQLNTGTE